MSRARHSPIRRGDRAPGADSRPAFATGSTKPRHLVWRYYAAVLRVFIEEPLFRGLFVLAVIALVTGTVFYHFAEGWGWLDSLYFSVVTLTTIGYGDFAPTTELARAFTIAYVLIGVGIIALFVTAVARAPFLQMELRRFREEHDVDGDEGLLEPTREARDERQG